MSHGSATRRSKPAPSTAAYRALVEHAPFGMHFYRLKPDGRLVFTGANPAADRLLGSEHTAYVGKTMEEAFPALIGSEIPARCRAVAERGAPWHAEQFTYSGDRMAGVFELHAFQPAPGEVAVTFQEISARARSEQALASEKERLAVTLRSIGDAVITTDAAGRVTLMNPPAEALTGWPSAEAAGRPLTEVFRIVAEQTGQPALDPAARVLGEGRVVALPAHTLLVSRDGARRPIADSGAPIHAPGGEVLGVVLVFRDQTAEREAEALLLESEARYRAVVRSVPLVQWAIDRRGVFTLSEGLGLASLGLKPGQVVGFSLDQAYPDNPKVHAQFRRALAGETFVVDDHERGRTFESTWGPVRNDAGAIVGVTGIARDVTDERALRERVARNQRLESVGRLAGGVAHDFNNLLTVVLSGAELLKEQAEAGQPASLEDVEQIAAAGQRARDLVRQLLAFARKQVITPEPTDLSRVLTGSQALLRRVLGEDVELALELEPGLWPVLCDAAQLEQVFLNLALNARDAMAGAGRLTIRAGNLAAARGGGGGDAPADWVRVEVRDTGGGLSEEARAHLFEPFFTTKAPGEGTGLGLSIVHGAVTQSGGWIEVESEPDIGTAFILFMPRCTAAVPAPAPREPVARVGGTETVLVVEDNPLVRSMTTRSLREAGYRVLVAADGREALAAALGAPHLELVVTDVVMPGMSGTVFARKLVERMPEVRVLFVSGYSREAVADRGLGEAGLNFLAKPFTASALLDRVRRVLDSPPLTRPAISAS